MSGYIGTQPVPQATQTRDSFTATANQTSFATSGYTPEFLDVFLNGVKLAASDYTATNGSDVVLASGAAASDILEVVAYSTFEVLNPTFDGNVTFTGNASFGDNDKAIFGDGNDLQIYHDGFNNYIEGSTGSIIIQNTLDDYNVIIKSDNGSGGMTDYFRAKGDTGSALMYHYGSEKLATTSTGVNVTGAVTSTGLIGNATNFDIKQNTSDGSDSKRTRIGGGGDVVSSRGAMIEMSGNEHGNGGMLFLHAGHGGAYSQIRSYTANTERMRIDSSGNVLVGKTGLDFGATAGQEFRADGRVFIGSTDGAFVNRIGSAGSIIGFRNDGSTIGSIGASAGLYIASAACGLRLHSGGTKIFPTTSSGGAADGTVDLGAIGGSWKDAYLSGGIYLGGTGSANKLDDYEEGTFTPSIKGVSNANAFTLSSAQGSYVKIGNQVTVNFMITATSVNGSSGVLTLTGLPFTVADVMSSTGIEANGVGAWWLTWATSINHLAYAAENNTNLLYLYGTTSGTQSSISNLTAAHMGNSGALRGSITYRTT